MSLSLPNSEVQLRDCQERGNVIEIGLAPDCCMSFTCLGRAGVGKDMPED